MLFDFDGVLVNSMAFHVRAWQEVFRAHDITIRPADILLTEGSRSVELARQIFDAHHIKISDSKLHQFVDRKQGIYREITEAVLQPGVQELLQMLQERRIFAGLVTGTTVENITERMPQQVTSGFQVMVTAEDVEIGKPDPHCYLKAAQHLKVEPEACLVVENAPLGIQAAKAAKMKVVALLTTLEKKFLRGADMHLENLKVLNDRFDTVIAALFECNTVNSQF